MNIGSSQSAPPGERWSPGPHDGQVRRREEPDAGGQPGERGAGFATYQTLFWWVALHEERGHRHLESCEAQEVGSIIKKVQGKWQCCWSGSELRYYPDVYSDADPDSYIFTFVRIWILIFDADQKVRLLTLMCIRMRIRILIFLFFVRIRILIFDADQKFRLFIMRFRILIFHFVADPPRQLWSNIVFLVLLAKLK
jgi:hypothetical protein